MAEAHSSFNMNNFLHNYSEYNKSSYTKEEVAQTRMAERDAARAAEAVKSNSLLNLTLKEKLTDIGIGERVMQQIGDTAMGAVEEIVAPIEDWLKKYETVFNTEEYYAQIQKMGKQMFFTRQALSEEARQNAPTFSINM